MTNALGTVNGDSITGTSGVDLISENLTNGSFTGGLSGDSFRFDTALNGATNVDRITDFTIAQGIRYNAGSGKLFYDLDGSGTAASMLIAQISKGLALSNNQLVVT